MHVLYVLWFGYTYPSLKGNGPEALFQTFLYGLLAWLFVPPFRKWINGHMKALHDKFDHHERLLQHVIKHSKDIPPYVHRDETGKFKKKS
jgi:hypothetical protein